VPVARSQLALTSIFVSALMPGCFLVGDFKLDPDAGAPRPSKPAGRPRPTESSTPSQSATDAAPQDAATSASVNSSATPASTSPNADGGAQADSSTAGTDASPQDSGISITLTPDAGADTSISESQDGSLTDAEVPLSDADAGVPGVDASTLPTATSSADAQQNQDETGIDCGGPCRPCPADLRHRYSFTGSGTEAVDSMGGAPGVVTGTTLNNAGYVDLRGGDYVDLPNGILSSLSSATIEIWLTWRGTSAWQRVFDFGSSSAGEGIRDYGADYLMFTPRGTDDKQLVDYSVNGLDGNVEVQGTSTLPARTEVHVAVVVDAVAATLSLYVNGQRDVLAPFNISLSQIDDNNNWIGRSQYSVDPAFNGNVTEVRIYGEALSGAQLLANHAVGPDALPWD
jgi:Concanavalin A-like lectin/glucanases superfamily